MTPAAARRIIRLARKTSDERITRIATRLERSLAAHMFHEVVNRVHPGRSLGFARDKRRKAVRAAQAVRLAKRTEVTT